VGEGIPLLLALQKFLQPVEATTAVGNTVVGVFLIGVVAATKADVVGGDCKSARDCSAHFLFLSI